MTDAKELLEELKTGVKEAVVDEVKASVTEVVASEVMDKLENQLKDIKEAKKDASEEEKEARENALKYFRARYQKDIYGRDSKGLELGRIEKDIDTGTSGSGQELVPEYFGNEVIRIAEKVGVARQNSLILPLPGKTFSLPTMGSVTGYRVDEKGKITASSPTTGQVKFTAKKVAAMVIATREAVEDANVNVLDWFARLAGEAIAKVEDQWAFLGINSGEGIFQASGVGEVTLGSGKTSYSDVEFDDLLTGIAKLNDNIVDEAVFAGSFSIFNALRGKKDSNGNYVYQNPGAGMPKTIWGLPYAYSTVMPKTTDGSQAGKSFLALYDPNYLLIGDRKALSLEFSKEATITSSDGTTTINLFEQDMVAVKVVERIDIQLAEADKAFVKFTTAAA